MTKQEIINSLSFVMENAQEMTMTPGGYETLMKSLEQAIGIVSDTRGLEEIPVAYLSQFIGKIVWIQYDNYQEPLPVRLHSISYRGDIVLYTLGGNSLQGVTLTAIMQDGWHFYRFTPPLQPEY